MNSTRVPKSRIVEAACRSDLLSFFYLCLQLLGPGSMLDMNWHLEAIAYHLELVMRGVIKRLIITAPPRTFKSLLTSVVFPVFMLGHDPTARIIGVSHGLDLQIGFSNLCRALIAALRVQRLFPGLELLKNTETEFHTTQGGYRYAKSAEGGLTGIGGRVLILDDFQRPLDMESEARRTATNNLYYSTVASRLDNQHTGAIVVVGHRNHMDDLIGRLLPQPEWTVLNLPAIAEKDEYIPIGPGRWHQRRVGDLLHPAQLSREVLESLHLQDPEIYAAQYQQSPIPPGGFIIKRDMIQYCDELPKLTSSLRLQSWDTAQKPGEANARSACLDILVLDNNYFIASTLVGQWEYHDLEQRVLSRAEKLKPNAILIEDTGFGTALISTLKQRGLPVVAVRPEGNKKSRLLQHISKFTNGQVFLWKNAFGRADLETELFSFPGGKRNDLVDALTQALAYKHVSGKWTDQAVENYGKLLWTIALSGGIR